MEGKGLIQSRRGEVTIRDREGLVEIADGGYGESEVEYERLVVLSTHSTFDRPFFWPAMSNFNAGNFTRC